jgi:hypothetical protein
MANDLAEYKTSVLATLQDTGVKYSSTTLDEALRRCLNDYTRAFPDFGIATITLTSSSRKIALTSLTDLISIHICLHPHDSTLTDIYSRAREDYTVTWTAGAPSLHFSKNPLPLSGDKVYLEYTKAQKIKDLDSATATTVRLDHKPILVAGAAGFSALIRAQSINEQWGGFPGQMPNLAQWGNAMVKQFNEQLLVIRQELNLNPFTKKGWKLDEWDI